MESTSCLAMMFALVTATHARPEGSSGSAPTDMNTRYETLAARQEVDSALCRTRHARA